MELFQDLDDEVFTESRSREKPTKLVSYNAKFCEKEWFCADAAVNDDTTIEEKVQVLKYRAELHYCRKQYSEALHNFDQVLYLVKSQNLPLRRDIDESRCRTLLALNRPTDALHVALHLHEESQNYDQKANTLSLLIKCYEKLSLSTAAVVCTQRLLALHPLNPEYWIQCARFYDQMTSDENPESSNMKQPTRISLYNEKYPCSMCMRENCTLCCIYRHKLKDIRVQIEECCDDCPSQDLAPEVHFQKNERTCSQVTKESANVPGKQHIPQGRHGCTSMLLTPYKSHIRNRDSCNGINAKSQEYEDKKLNHCDMDGLCYELENVDSVDTEHGEEAAEHANSDARKAVCISLVRARYLLKNIEINLVSFTTSRYRTLITSVDEWLEKLSLDTRERAFYEKWTSRDFGLDTQGKCRASSPFSLAKGDSSAKLNDYVRVFNKSEEVVDACDLDVRTWFSHRWLTPPKDVEL